LGSGISQTTAVGLNQECIDASEGKISSQQKLDLKFSQDYDLFNFYYTNDFFSEATKANISKIFRRVLLRKS
jgi:hypothetical protein